MTYADYAIVVVFLAGTFWVGTRFYHWVGHPDDFYVAGRQLTPFILAAALTATNVNLYSFVGQAGVAYKHGISILWQTWTGNMALMFSGLFVLPIFRRLRIRTIPEFLEMRYSPAVRYLVAILWILRLSFWLGVVLYTAAVAAESITGLHSFVAWALIFSVITIIYTMHGGMWSVALVDVLQFVLMMAGALIVLPLAMKAVGWWPGLVAQIGSAKITLVKAEGLYNYKFIFAIFLLGIEWACVDQGMMQRAFSGRDVKSVAKSMVLAGIITTPFALLWNLPGLAAGVLYPNLANPDMAMPILLAKQLPTIILGLVVCGLISAQMSTISANLNSVATLFTNDLYTRWLHRKASEDEALRIARIVTVVTGVFMIFFSFLVPMLGGAVNAYLTVIAIMDMPLFVIAILYGLLWRRATVQGAFAGYLAGAFAGALVQFGFGQDFNTSTFWSAGAALVVTPLISWLTKKPDAARLAIVEKARHSSAEEREKGIQYHIIPKSLGGRFSLAMIAVGLFVFLTGVFMGKFSYPLASHIAVLGMILYFASGLLRLRFD